MRQVKRDTITEEKMTTYYHSENGLEENQEKSYQRRHKLPDFCYEILSAGLNNRLEPEEYAQISKLDFEGGFSYSI